MSGNWLLSEACHRDPSFHCTPFISLLARWKKGKESLICLNIPLPPRREEFRGRAIIGGWAGSGCLCRSISALAGDSASLFFEVRNQGPDEPLGKLLQSGSIQSSKASRGDPLPSFISKLYSNHQMVASCEALWKSVYFSVSQAVLTLCSPGSLCRSLGLCWPSVGMAGWTSLPAYFFPLCLLIGNWR